MDMDAAKDIFGLGVFCGIILTFGIIWLISIATGGKVRLLVNRDTVKCRGCGLIEPPPKGECPRCGSKETMVVSN